MLNKYRSYGLRSGLKADLTWSDNHWEKIDKILKGIFKLDRKNKVL